MDLRDATQTIKMKSILISINPLNQRFYQLLLTFTKTDFSNKKNKIRFISPHPSNQRFYQ